MKCRNKYRNENALKNLEGWDAAVEAVHQPENVKIQRDGCVGRRFDSHLTVIIRTEETRPTRTDDPSFDAIITSVTRCWVQNMKQENMKSCWFFYERQPLYPVALGGKVRKQQLPLSLQWINNLLANEYCSWKPPDDPAEVPVPVIKVTARAPPDEMTSWGKREPQNVKRWSSSL